eukprot:Skav205993  [mRNA]  locus=scaffold2084:123029:124222:+ [translate_table: standard]
MASGGPSADRPRCFNCDAETSKRLKCPSCAKCPSGRGTRIALCDDEACFLNRTICITCGTEMTRSDYGTSSDCSDDISSACFTAQQQVSTLFQELLKMVKEGQFDEARDGINHIQACVMFMEGRVLHAEAVKLSADESSKVIEKAWQAAYKSVKLFQKLALTKQEHKVMYADALLLYANTAARVVRQRREEQPSRTSPEGEMMQADVILKEFKQRREDQPSCEPSREEVEMVANARKNAVEAAKVLHRFQHPNEGNAYRVCGVIELTQNNFEEARTYFIKALRTFLNTRQEAKTVWCAVTFWDMHIAQRELGKEGKAQPSVAWLKAATILQEKVEGKNSPYRRVYRGQLITLTENRFDNATHLMLAEEEMDEICSIIDEICPIKVSYKEKLKRINRQ